MKTDIFRDNIDSMFLLSEKIQTLLNKASIKENLRIIFIIVFIIPLIILSSFFITSQYKTISDLEIDKVQSSLNQTKKIFNNTLAEVKIFSDRLYINTQIQNVLLKKYYKLQDVFEEFDNLDFMEDYLHTYTIVSSYYIFTENETLLDNQFIKQAKRTIKNEEWYIKAILMEGQAFWSYIQDPVSNRYCLSLIRAIRSSSNGLFAGVLIINVNSDALKHNINTQDFNSIIALNNERLYILPYAYSETDRDHLTTVINNNRYSDSKIKRLKLDNKIYGLIGVDYIPLKTDAMKFNIMYLIPNKQLSAATLKVLMIAIIEILIVVVLSVILIMAFSSYIDVRVLKIRKEIKNIVENNFEIAETIGGNDEFEQIYQAIFKMSCNIKELIDTVYLQKLETEKIAVQQSKMSFKMLANQINPHFLFNTIETIRMKSLTTGDKEVATMLKLLASLLRYNLSMKGQPVRLKDEINAIQNYLTIQHMRFGDRVSYKIDTFCDIEDVMILPLLIQPLVENSFSHGLEDRVSGGFIYVSIDNDRTNDKNDLVITVKDNGSGFDSDKMAELERRFNSDEDDDSSTSIGMVNVNSRIKLFYGKEYGLSIKSDFGEGTEVTIRIKGN